MNANFKNRRYERGISETIKDSMNADISETKEDRERGYLKNYQR